MLLHGIVNSSHVTGLLSLIDSVTDAIDVQVAKKQGRSRARNRPHFAARRNQCATTT